MVQACEVHVNNPAEVFLKDGSLNAGPDDDAFLQSLRRSLKTARGAYPPVALAEIYREYKSPLTKIRRIQKWNIQADGFHPILVANARVDWLALKDDDITKKFPILLEGILQDVFSQRASSAWQGAQPQKLTVSMLLPGTSTASEWRDLLQSRRQFWPTLTTRHASLVPVSTEALQRERRQMQAKHLWYNLDIRWVDLEEKLEVLAPTGLTRDDIWRHLFLTKQRKNPYVEGCYNGEDLEDVKRQWEAKKEYFLRYKKDGSRPPCIDLATALHGFGIDNTAAQHAIEGSKALHARTMADKRRYLPY